MFTTMEHTLNEITDDVPSTLFHYTDSNGLLGILGSHKLWASHIQYLNDPAELSYAHTEVELLMKVRLHEAEAAGNLKQVAVIQGVMQTIDERFSGAKDLDPVDGDTPYVVSFSKEGDDLGMWRSYAGAVGYAIGFDTQKLLEGQSKDEESEHSWEDPFFNCGLTAELVPVSYGTSRVAAVADELLAAERCLDEYGGYRDATLFGGIKHPAYREEKEVRLIASPSGCLEAQTHLRSGPGHLVPYLEFSFVEEAITSIRVGPAPQQTRSLNALRIHLRQGGRGPVGYFDDIVASAIPYLP